MVGGLRVHNVSVQVEGKRVLDQISLNVPPGEVHAIMGPNGSGKSSLALAVAGHPRYRVTDGEIEFDGKSMLGMTPDERAQAGLFLSFQSPIEVPGLKFAPYLRTMMNVHRNPPVGIPEALQEIKAALQQVGLPESVLERGLNEGFSGGERKRAEILQLILLKPRLGILDETDSGLDIDALRTIAAVVTTLRSPTRSFLVITHYRRLLDYLKPNVVHLLRDGTITQAGGFELVDAIEARGYAHSARQTEARAKSTATDPKMVQ